MLAREKQGRGDDATLLERVLRRDERAWRELVQAHEPALRALFEENEELLASDVDDVIAELWLRVVEDDRRRLRRFAQTRPSSLAAWLAMQASQAAHAFVAKRGPTTSSIDDVPPIADRPRLPRPRSSDPRSFAGTSPNTRASFSLRRRKDASGTRRRVWLARRGCGGRGEGAALAGGR